MYFDAVTASGGIAVLLPPQPAPRDRAARVVLDGLDGLILTGGDDVQPELLRAGARIRAPTRRAPTATRGSTRCSAAPTSDELPFLGICRGLQLLNVARGGTLHQHLPEALGTERYRIGGGVFATNRSRSTTGTRLAELRRRRTTLDVHSYHHQGVDRARRRARRDRAHRRRPRRRRSSPTACAYRLGVQWHPEEDAEDRRLFAGLVAAASATPIAPEGADA